VGYQENDQMRQNLKIFSPNLSLPLLDEAGLYDESPVGFHD